jgi:hypothetical protein
VGAATSSAATSWIGFSAIIRTIGWRTAPVAVRIDPKEPSRSIALRRISFWMVLLPVVFPFVLVFGILVLILVVVSIYERIRGVELGE